MFEHVVMISLRRWWTKNFKSDLNKYFGCFLNLDSRHYNTNLCITIFLPMHVVDVSTYSIFPCGLSIFYWISETFWGGRFTMILKLNMVNIYRKSMEIIIIIMYRLSYLKSSDTSYFNVYWMISRYNHDVFSRNLMKITYIIQSELIMP